MDTSKLIAGLTEVLGTSQNSSRLFFAPGRVNLIGEHTDYNGGMVFSMAIDAGTYLLIRLNDCNSINFCSTNFSFKTQLDLDNLNKLEAAIWVNYPLGIINEFVKRGIKISGFDLLFFRNIPPASGLSSSASIEMVTAYALNQIFKAELDRMDLVKLCKKSENEFIGVNCGVMDMFAIAFGKKNNAIALNCNSMDFKYSPLKLGDYRFVIANTNKERGLAD